MATNRYTVLDRADVLDLLPMGPGAIIARAIADHTAAIQRLGPLQPIMADVAARMLVCLQAGGKVLFMGNGGSASDAQHLAAELMGRFERERRALPAIALTTDTSILTAIANDYSYDTVFARQIQALARPGDVVVGISTSGNSANVLAGLRTARELGAVTVGITGRTGGQMVALCDVCLVSPADNTARIQETHILMGHIICDLVERGFVGDEPARQ